MSLVVPTRRGILVGLGAVIAAPAIVRAVSLMPIKALPVEQEIGVLNVLGGTPPYMFSVSNPAFAVRGSTIVRSPGAKLLAGEYELTLTVVDANGCMYVEPRKLRVA